MYPSWLLVKSKWALAALSPLAPLLPTSRLLQSYQGWQLFMRFEVFLVTNGNFNWAPGTLTKYLQFYGTLELWRRSSRNLFDVRHDTDVRYCWRLIARKTCSFLLVWFWTCEEETADAGNWHYEYFYPFISVFSPFAFLDMDLHMYQLLLIVFF